MPACKACWITSLRPTRKPEIPAPTQRLFFALWPQPELRQQLARLARDVPAHGHPVAEHNLHLTLVFLGNITADTRNCLSAAAAELHVPHFTLTLDQTGYWPKPRTVWLGVNHIPDALLALVAGLNAALTKCGLTPERRSYQPHITLLRKVEQPQGKLLLQPLEWKAESFCLVESSSEPDGVVYRILNSWNLD